MLEITFIRHGQVESNAHNAYIGWTNKPLTLTGISQAKELAGRLKHVPFDAIYTSPLERAKYTADILRGDNNVRVILDDGLKEWNFGIFDDLTFSAIQSKYPDEAKRWQENWWNYKIPKGESAREAYERHTAAISEIIGRYPDGGKICIVSHLCALRNMFTYLMGMKPEDATRFSIKNALINKIILIDDNEVVLTALNA